MKLVCHTLLPMTFIERIYPGGIGATPHSNGMDFGRALNQFTNDYWEPAVTSGLNAVFKLRTDTAVNGFIFFIANNDASFGGSTTYLQFSDDGVSWSTLATAVFTPSCYETPCLVQGDAGMPVVKKWWRILFTTPSVKPYFATFALSYGFTLSVNELSPETFVDGFRTYSSKLRSGDFHVRRAGTQSNRRRPMRFHLESVADRVTLENIFIIAQGTRRPFAIHPVGEKEKARLVKFKSDQMIVTEVVNGVKRYAFEFVDVPYVQAGSEL